MKKRKTSCSNNLPFGKWRQMWNSQWMKFPTLKSWFAICGCKRRGKNRRKKKVERMNPKPNVIRSCFRTMWMCVSVAWHIIIGWNRRQESHSHTEPEKDVKKKIAFIYHQFEFNLRVRRAIFEQENLIHDCRTVISIAYFLTLIKHNKYA